MTRIGRAVALALVTASCATESPGSSSTPVNDPAADSARGFVQEFYDWYVLLWNAPADRYDSVLTRRASSFSPTLLTALRDDIEAQKGAVGEIVGVTGDYDPFLNSQDPCERYEARDATATPRGFGVGVYAICNNILAQAPSIVVEVERSGGRWLFVNFRDLANPAFDLMSQLHRARVDRQRSASPDTTKDPAS